MEPARVLNFPVHHRETIVFDLPTPALEGIPDQSLLDLLHVARNVTKGAQEVVSFVDQNRDRARDLGIETIAIELTILLETGRLERVLEELERAAAEGRPAQLSDDGMRRLRKAEKLISEANALRKPTARTLTPRVMGQSASNQTSTSIWIPLAILGAVVVIVGIVTSLSSDAPRTRR